MSEPSFWQTLWAKVKALVLSRKFWAAVGATIVLFTTPGLTVQQLMAGVVATWSVFIGATAIEDGLRAR